MEYVGRSDGNVRAKITLYSKSRGDEKDRFHDDAEKHFRLPVVVNCRIYEPEVTELALEVTAYHGDPLCTTAGIVKLQTLRGAERAAFVKLKRSVIYREYLARRILGI
jgi:hypothetical protein